MIERRQRQAARTVGGALAVLAVLAGACGAEQPLSLPESPATAIAAVQAAQATAGPVATAVADTVARLQPDALGPLLSSTLGVSVQVTLEPPNTPNDQVTRVALGGTDQTGTFERLDPLGRQTLAMAGLGVARRAFPRATLELTVLDRAGVPLLAVVQAPDGAARFQ